MAKDIPQKHKIKSLPSAFSEKISAIQSKCI